MSKKSKNKKRDRFEALTVEFDERNINPETGRIEINISFDMVNDVNQITLAHNNQVMPVQSLLKGYMGEKKFRTLSEIPIEEDDFSFNFIKKLQRYDRLVAVDTNSGFFMGRKVSLGVPFHITGKIYQDKIEWELIPLNKIFALMGESEKLENKNWVQLIKYILSHSNYNSDQKVGFIVDSDLGNLKRYNEGALPLDSDFYLPQNFELIYASDRANDNILNEVMLICHRVSKDILKTYIECLQEVYEEVMQEKAEDLK